MFLSIIIPTLNEEKYLPILLSSLVFQTNKKFEVIVSDGNSEDKTKEKALEFEDRLDIKICSSNKRNVSHQRNYGAEKAKGDYLIFSDADHRVENNFIELIYEEIRQTSADVIIPISIYDTKKLFWRGCSLVLDIFVRSAYFFFKKPFGSGPTQIIKKDVFEKTGGYDESIFFFEDHSLLQLIGNSGAKIYHSKKIKTYSSTRRMDKIGILKFFYLHAMVCFSFIRGPIKKKLFEYEMGGRAHKKL